MSFFSKVADTLTGGLASTVMNTIKAYFPPDMTPEQQSQMQLALENLELKKKAQAAEIERKAEEQVTKRIAELEGTASELKSIPILGPIMLFLRGCQRPVWGFLTLYMDMMWFSGSWGTLTATQERALMMVNFLVLAFLFGERAIKNALPAIKAFTAKGEQSAQEKP
ncbi:hypothetical protein [Vibrio paucivorans]